MSTALHKMKLQYVNFQKRGTEKESGAKSSWREVFDSFTSGMLSLLHGWCSWLISLSSDYIDVFNGFYKGSEHILKSGKRRRWFYQGHLLGKDNAEARNLSFDTYWSLDLKLGENGLKNDNVSSIGRWWSYAEQHDWRKSNRSPFPKKIYKKLAFRLFMLQR